MATNDPRPTREQAARTAGGRPSADFDAAPLTAYHEAGHIVMCLMHRVFPLSATIERRVDGDTEYLGLVCHGVSAGSRRWHRAAIDVALAGMVAEARFHRHDGAEAGWMRDCSRALALAAEAGIRGRRAERLLRRRLDAIDRRFAEPRAWQAVELVAAALLVERSLTESRMLATCRAASALLHSPRTMRRQWTWPGYAALAYVSFHDGLGPERRRAIRRARWSRVAIIAACLAIAVARGVLAH